MLLSAVLCVLLAAAAQAGYVTAGYPPVPTCGKQPCPRPNRCEYRGPDIHICVLPDPPSCAAIFCGYGTECVLQQKTCNTRPCNPQPVCIKKNTNPCGICSPPDQFCELFPSKGSPPTCRYVEEPRCDNKVCQPGTKCREEPLQCIQPPCYKNLVCRRPAGYGSYGYSDWIRD